LAHALFNKQFQRNVDRFTFSALLGVINPHAVSKRRPSLEEGPGILGLMEGSMKMRLEKIARLLVVSIVILTGSPALAGQIPRHDGYCRSCVQKAGGCRDRTFGFCAGRESDAPRWNGRNSTHDDWSAGMILG
jgi:hypothetical protein